MEFTRFSMGLRFAMTADADLTPEKVWGIVFSRVPNMLLTDVKLYGMWDDAFENEPEPAYICLFSNMRLSVGKRLYDLYSTDAALCSYLTAHLPFVQNNYVEQCSTVEYLGQIQPNGAVICGDVKYADMRFFGPKRPVPNRSVKTPAILIASEWISPLCTPADAARRICRAAAKAYPNARIVLQRIADGGRGTTDALVASCAGRYARTRATGLVYGVLPDRHAVLETDGRPPETIAAAIDEIRDDGYPDVILAAGKDALPETFPAQSRVTVLSALPLIEQPEGENVQYRSGIDTVLHYGGVLHMLESAALVVVATNAADESCALLGATADTICFQCRKFKRPCAVIARGSDGGYLVREQEEPAKAFADQSLFEVAEEVFLNYKMAGAGQPAVRRKRLIRK